jgi:AraC-like DNA-binding protein
VRYREFAPGPELEGLVHRYWTLEGAAPGGAPEFQRAMPDGRPELIFNLADPFERRHPGGLERQPLSLLVGPTTRAIQLRPTGRVDLVGVRLVPGRWPAMLDLDGEALLDEAVALPDTSRRWREDLLEPLAEAPADARIAILERRLRRVAATETRGDRRPDARLRSAVDLTFRARGGLPVRRVAELAGVSPRHLTRLFRLGTGMGPALLGRVVRFQQVLGELERPGAVRWGALAHRHGYYDQAHLCRDFRRFGGLSPARYLAVVRDLTRHFVDGAGAGGAPLSP